MVGMVINYLLTERVEDVKHHLCKKCELIVP